MIDDISLERLQEISAEANAWELVQMLKDALADAPRWRRDAQRLLREIDAGSLPAPPPEFLP